MNYSMSKAKSVVALICGVVALVGIFLPWMDSGSGLTISGWELPRQPGDISAPQPILAFVGSIAMIILGALAVIKQFGIAKPGAIKGYDIAYSIASFIVIVACLWYVIFLCAFLESESMKYGVIVSLVVAGIGLGLGVSGFVHIFRSR